MRSADINEKASDKWVFQSSQGTGWGLIVGSQTPKKREGEDHRMFPAHPIIDNSVIKHQKYKCNNQNQRLPAHGYEGEMDQNNLTALIVDSEKPPLLSWSPFLHTRSK